MIARVLVLALLIAGCSKSRVTMADASGDSAGATPTDAGSEKAIVDAGPQRPLPDSLTWRPTAKALAYFRGDDLYIVDDERFMPKVKTRIPHLSFAQLLPLDKGGALVFGADGEQGDAMQKVVIVDKAGAQKTVDLGTARSIPMEVDPSGRVLAPVVVDEEAGTFARLLVADPDEFGLAAPPPRVTFELRSLDDGSVRSTTKMPAWFRGRMNMPPTLFGCRGSLCAFGVAPPGAQPTFDEDTLLLSLFDLKERAPMLVSSVQLGPSGGVAFGKGNTIAVALGAGSDPILVDAKTIAVRALGRRGKKAEVMQAASCIAFSADGSLLASTSEHEGVSLFETATGKRRWKTGEEARSVAHWRSCGVMFGADGHVLDYSRLGNIQKLDVATGKRLNDFERARMHNSGHPTAVGNESWLTSGTLSPKGSFFFLSDRDSSKTVLLDTRTWTETPMKEDGSWDLGDRYWVAGEIVHDAATLKPNAILF